jgi:hypothetical protein
MGRLFISLSFLTFAHPSPSGSDEKRLNKRPNVVRLKGAHKGHLATRVIRLRNLGPLILNIPFAQSVRPTCYTVG